MSLSVIDSIHRATARTNRLGLILGSTVGAIAPVGVFSIAHSGVILSTLSLWRQPVAYLALGGLVFSALSVVTWTERLFRSKTKAIAWTILVEGIMTFAPPALVWLSWVCLALLIGVNAISNGCSVALDRAESRPRKARQSNVRQLKRAA